MIIKATPYKLRSCSLHNCTCLITDLVLGFGDLDPVRAYCVLDLVYQRQKLSWQRYYARVALFCEHAFDGEWGLIMNYAKINNCVG